MRAVSLFSGIGLMGGPRSGAKPKVYPDDLVDRVRRLYEAGATQNEVAAALGVSQKVVWNLMRRHGIPRRSQTPRDQRGERGHGWKGDKASYTAFHARLYTQRGRPMECEVCGTTDPERAYDWANLTGHYEDLHDYKRMCRSCHSKFDGKIRNITKGVVPNA